ncbi:MAG: hypothetical protein HYX35_03645 [Proteobacteria bacterium]|nr:hypothetical protein [Pseudomonadota bacterium]
MKSMILSTGLFLIAFILNQPSAFACNYWTNAGCHSPTPYCEWTPLKHRDTHCMAAQLTSPQEKKQQLQALKEKISKAKEQK